MELKLGAVIALVMVALLAIAGCITQSPTLPNNTQTDTQLGAFTDAFHDSVQKILGPNETLRTWNETTQGTDVIRVRYAIFNNTNSAFNINGTTTNVDMKVQQFQSIANASTFVDDKNFGYIPASQNNTTTVNSTNLNAIYDKAIGHLPTTTSAYLKIESFTFVTAQVSFVMQVDEFVVYGYATASTSANGTVGTASSTASPKPSSSINPVTPTPTAQVTATPTPTTAKIATSILFARDPTVAKGGTLEINVLASGITICGHGAVTATIGTISSEGSSDCFHTAFLDTSGLSQGTHAITLTFSCDSTYQASQLNSIVTIT